jgi:hypothetical protein
MVLVKRTEMNIEASNKSYNFMEFAFQEYSRVTGRTNLFGRYVILAYSEASIRREYEFLHFYDQEKV